MCHFLHVNLFSDSRFFVTLRLCGKDLHVSHELWQKSQRPQLVKWRWVPDCVPFMNGASARCAPNTFKPRFLRVHAVILLCPSTFHYPSLPSSMAPPLVISDLEIGGPAEQGLGTRQTWTISSTTIAVSPHPFAVDDS